MATYGYVWTETRAGLWEYKTTRGKLCALVTKCAKNNGAVYWKAFIIGEFHPRDFDDFRDLQRSVEVVAMNRLNAAKSQKR